jgi:hypothetical protein
MSIQLAKCKECQNFPDIAWMAQGGNTPQNVWAQVTMCRDCWAAFVKADEAGYLATLRAEACDGRF